MPFKEELVTPIPKVKQYDLTISKQLASAISKKNKITRPYSVSSWAFHIAQLRTVDKVDRERIGNVANWYASHVGEEYVPQAFSAKGFRSKFLQIEAAMRRFTDIYATVTISEEAKDILRSLRHFKWPKGSAEQLPPLVQVSLDNYRDFLRRLSGRGFRVLAVAPFITKWWENVHKQVSHWKDWSGDLKPFVFRRDSPGFKKFGYQWASERGLKSTEFFKLMEEVYAD